ncbi:MULTISPECIES: hypothetical protein [Acinetobacter]|jgi:hypothetical protein|uniref:hypothetical protein n=1 Tax=Acinetobacter TaxID=469 RepID=UPI0022E40466|nr:MULTISPECIES: hypothetical protein [Acinetobacter]MDI1224175.1 hypothetical protein [Acinetobacter sp.]
MKCYLISYDLRKTRNYEALYEAIKSFGTWGKINESTWIIGSYQSAVQIRDYLLNFIDSDDRLFIVKSDREAAWQNVMADNQWLKNTLSNR